MKEIVNTMDSAISRLQKLLPQINCITRDEQAICPKGWLPYNIEMIYKLRGVLINTEEKVYALNGWSASKYGMLYIKKLGGGTALKMRVNKNK